MIGPENSQKVIERINAIYDDSLVQLALDGLPKMFLPDESAFCEIAQADSRHNLILSGLSLRYTAMSLIGLTMQESLGRPTDLPLDKITARLVAWCTEEIAVGEVGLLIWALALRNDPRIDQVARILVDQTATLLDEKFSFSSMSLGWLLTGLSVAVQKQLGPPQLSQIAERAYNKLMKNRSKETGLFSLATPLLRKNIFIGRLNAKLGSFASQVYPVIGLSYYSIAQKCPEALDIAQRNVDQLCRLQGAQGQWWWLYRVKDAEPAVKYPVYSVHQDAMGPMFLLAARLAGAEGEKQLSAVEKSLRWFQERNELASEALIDREKSVVWRAIQRDAPERTGGFGLGVFERLRMHRTAWLGGSDTREFTKGYVCRQCRPYHLGWILYAAALAHELGESIK
jgi:hypothetical protein